MNNIILHIAGFKIKISFYSCDNFHLIKSFQKGITDFFRDFLISEKINESVNYIIHIKDSPHKIYSLRGVKNGYREYIGLFLERLGENEIVTYSYLSLDQFIHLLNFTVIKLLSDNGGFVLHGSAVEINKEVIIFTGKSGAGKSTVVNLLQDVYTPLEDDRVIINKINNQYFFFHSAFFLKNRKIKKTTQPRVIKSIFFLRKAKLFKTEEITNKNDILYLMLNQLVTDLDTKEASIRNLQKFIAKFNNFKYLYFDKNKKGIVDFIKQIFVHKA